MAKLAEIGSKETLVIMKKELFLRTIRRKILLSLCQKN